ncbi:hypothetical protein [Limibacterium fermenti]|uniref:hypothetical protein n=1 Tax=Limibacterium fermenti TaxID=3229863 RepID=UPI003A748DA3
MMFSDHYIHHLLKKANRTLYCNLAARYHTSPWVICRLIHGKSIRSEKELSIYRKLIEGQFVGKE